MSAVTTAAGTELVHDLPDGMVEWVAGSTWAALHCYASLPSREHNAILRLPYIIEPKRHWTTAHRLSPS